MCRAGEALQREGLREGKREVLGAWRGGGGVKGGSEEPAGYNELLSVRAQ